LAFISAHLSIIESSILEDPNPAIGLAYFSDLVVVVLLPLVEIDLLLSFDCSMFG